MQPSSRRPTSTFSASKLIIDRYHPDVVFHEPNPDTTGHEYTFYNDGSVTITVSTFILKLLRAANVDLVLAALYLSLFSAVDAIPLRSINGVLIWLLPVRFKEVRWLCKHNHHSTLEDCQKHIQVLRFLQGVPTFGPTSSYSGHNGGPPAAYIVSDVGHAVHPHTGANQITILHMGNPNATFFNQFLNNRAVMFNDMARSRKCYKDYPYTEISKTVTDATRSFSCMNSITLVFQFTYVNMSPYAFIITI